MYKSKLGKIVSSAAIIGIFVIALLAILMITKTIDANRVLIDLLIIIGVLCVGALYSRIVLKLLDRNEKKIFLYISLGLIGLTCILWIIFVFIGQNIIDNIIADTAEEISAVSVFNYLKFAVFISIQSVVYTFIISNIYILKKNKIVLQGISCLSALVSDFWLSGLIFSCTVVEDKATFRGNWLFEKGMLTVAIIAMVFMVISSIILKKLFKHSAEDFLIDSSRKEKVVEAPFSEPDKIEQGVEKPVGSSKPTIEERIKKLDALKAQGLINDEEYSEKKKSIIDEL